MRHSSESPQVGHEESESKVGDWHAEVEKALEHNSPDRLLVVVSEVVDKHSKTLTKDEREFLLRVMKHARVGASEREERWDELVGRIR